MNVIKKIRIQRDETQREFAQESGVSLDTVKSWEMGRRHPTGTFVEMLMLLNKDPDLNIALEDLHPIHCMAKEILAYIDEQKDSHGEDFEVRFVLCGVSGCGKTRAVSIVNDTLPKGAELAEDTDLIFPRNLCKALAIVNKEGLAYQNSKHIAFSVMNEDLASSLENNEIKVFRFN
jgi:transcriptional regulator with XRE-family HTH domain